jgi:hypothetical protein
LRAVLIHKWKPWENSTGPRTVEGKAKVSRNAYKGGRRAILRALSNAVRAQERFRRRTLSAFK